MADDAAADLGDDLGGAGDAPAKKGGLKGAFPALLKWILIALAAVIFIITVVFIAVKLMTGNSSSNTVVPISEEYNTQREELEWYTSLEDIRTQTPRATSLPSWHRLARRTTRLLLRRLPKGESR